MGIFWPRPDLVDLFLIPMSPQTPSGGRKRHPLFWVLELNKNQLVEPVPAPGNVLWNLPKTVEDWKAGKPWSACYHGLPVPHQGASPDPNQAANQLQVDEHPWRPNNSSEKTAGKIGKRKKNSETNTSPNVACSGARRGGSAAPRWSECRSSAAAMRRCVAEKLLSQQASNLRSHATDQSSRVDSVL